MIQKAEFEKLQFGDYWDSYLVLWDRVMLSLKLKKKY